MCFHARKGEALVQMPLKLQSFCRADSSWRNIETTRRNPRCVHQVAACALKVASGRCKRSPSCSWDWQRRGCAWIGDPIQYNPKSSTWVMFRGSSGFGTPQRLRNHWISPTVESWDGQQGAGDGHRCPSTARTPDFTNPYLMVHLTWKLPDNSNL